MRRARSVTGPLRRAHPASGATWNVQVVRGKMSSKCLWHACRALSAGLLLMLLGSAMAVIGYYADTLSVDQEVRGNATVSVKDEARGFHLNNLSYAGPIVMGFGGFIVVAACVMTFEARDSAAKVTPARPQALPRPIPRRGPQCAPARLDQLGVYRLPHVLPLPHILPIAPLHRHRPPPVRITGAKAKGSARFGSAPDLRSTGVRATLPVAMLRRPLRRYALSVDEPPHSAVSASAMESECGSQSSLALDLHGSGACAGVTLRVRDNTRRRPLARQQRLRDDIVLATPIGSTGNLNAEEIAKKGGKSEGSVEMDHLSVDNELRASSAPPATHVSPQPSPTLTVTSPLELENVETSITIDITELEIEKQFRYNKTQKIHIVPPKQMVLDIEELEEDRIDEEFDTDNLSEDSERVQLGTQILSELEEVNTENQFSSKSLAQELEDAIDSTAKIHLQENLREDFNENAQIDDNLQKVEEISAHREPIVEHMCDESDRDNSLHSGQEAKDLVERNRIADSEVESVICDPIQASDI